ncbi:MAG: DUF2809 domain-containing protein [Moorea sp. SIO2B7]|nr:DUF2809 domain-containing protein [Moorena sp. SIO2B7]
MKIIRERRLLTLLSLLIVIPLGVLSKFYSGPDQQWVNGYAGGVLYELFWCLFVFLLISSSGAIMAIPLWVFAITCILEIMQLWQTPIVQPLRSSFIGRWLLGTTFSWLRPPTLPPPLAPLSRHEPWTSLSPGSTICEPIRYSRSTG